MYNNAKIDEINVSEPLSIFKTSMKPFLKWAGGKSQLISELAKYIPQSFYHEDHLGKEVDGVVVMDYRTDFYYVVSN